MSLLSTTLVVFLSFLTPFHTVQKTVTLEFLCLLALSIVKKNSPACLNEFDMGTMILIQYQACPYNKNLKKLPNL